MTASSLQELLRDGKLAGSWALDAAASEIGLKSKSMWGMVSVKGVFRQVTGTGTVSAAGDVTGTVTVAAGSVNTKIKKRDEHLRSADFFDVANYPDFTFAAEQVTPSGEGVTVTGTLTVRDRTRPLTFGATVSTPDTGEIELDAEIQVNRSDYGMTWSPMRMASMDNTITIHAVFTHT